MIFANSKKLIKERGLEMYAVVEISGKQQLVKENEIIKIDRLPY
ncbi:MAG: bL21 family ribosomal protein, partial [Candidatus Pacebacteria bacterium]|nr:bL21 family ribosomal protein [Candidatus Paceibacterota bacterium]